MTGERICLIEGTPYSVTISDEEEALSAAYAAGGAIIGIWDRTREGQCLKPAEYIVESADDIDEELLECVVRRRFHLPWIIAETSRLVIREFVESDYQAMPQGETHLRKNDLDSRGEASGGAEAGNAVEAVFEEEETFKAYIDHQYRFYEYGIWALEEKESGRIIGRAGLFNTEWDMRKAEKVLFPIKKEDTPLELGYHIFLPWRRKGYAKEACEAILRYAVSHIKTPLCAVIDADNEASIRLAGALGFLFTAERYNGSAGRQYLYVWNCSGW